MCPVQASARTHEMQYDLTGATTGTVYQVCVQIRQYVYLQVAINWTICKGAVPIPGAKSARQAKEAAGLPTSQPGLRTSIASSVLL